MMWFFLLFVVMAVLVYHHSSLKVFSLGVGAYLLMYSALFKWSLWANIALFFFVFIPLLVMNLPFLRRKLLSVWVFQAYQKQKPSMSQTEKEALESGTVGWEGDLFSGHPDWDKLLRRKVSYLTEKEQAFLDNEVEKLCEIINNWRINLNPVGITRDIWDRLKSQRFFSLIISEKFGGRDFSARGHSEVISKISSTNTSVGPVAGVPNSLGPAELLLHYGSEQQKNYYLPRLASGEEVPCFALTSQRAGSDASSMQDYGVVCRCHIDGQEGLGIKLYFSKRYITLSPVATLLGLAFKLYDPDHLLGNQESLGITCALIPMSTPGIQVGRHHLPMHSAFPNGPVAGHEVIISLDQVIGGRERVGQGWKMLMECLANGRGISIPSVVNGGIKMMTLATGAYARIREQFGCAIADFEGVADVLAEMASNTFISEAMRQFICSALDDGERPAVASAIAKYHVSQMGQKVAVAGMDVHGGRAICLGPDNYIAQMYIESPISITVEGANILTRNMMIFGQGVMRCHPFVLKELQAAQKPGDQGLVDFDQAFWGHCGFFVSNLVRSLLLSWGGACWVQTPVKGRLSTYYRRFTRWSSHLAVMADTALLALGPALKRSEYISARLGDMLSYLYMGSCVLKYYNDQPDETLLDVVSFICEDLCFKMENTLFDLTKNLPRALGLTLRLIMMPLGRRCSPPSDHLRTRVAKLISTPSSLRDRLMLNVHTSAHKNNPAGQMIEGLEKIMRAMPIEKKLKQAIKSGHVHGYTSEEHLSSALESALLTLEESEVLRESLQLREKLMAVNDFSLSEYHQAYEYAKQDRVNGRENETV